MMLRHFFILATATIAAAAPQENEPTLRRRADVRFDVQQAAVNALPLDKQLISLSIEFGNTVDFFGDIGRPNTFSKQLLQNIVDRSGVPTILRIGGNTQDRADFCENCAQTLSSIILNNPNDPKRTEAVEVTFNKNLFTILMENVPAGSPIIFGLNLRDNNYDIAQAEIDGAFKYLNQSLVMAYELGNEVNLYGPHRPQNYDVGAYAEQMRDWIPRLRARSNIDSKFQFASFAGPPQWFRRDMTIAELVRRNVPQSIAGIEYFSVHGYPYNICSPSEAAKVNLGNFLDHQRTKDLVNMYRGEIDAVRPLGKKMHMGETGSVACHGKDGVSNTLGATLWTLDYALTGATAGIDRFFFHAGHGDFFYSMWEPLPSPVSPSHYLNPTYYSMLFVADLVADLDNPRVASLPSLDTRSAVHFAIYDGDDIQKLVILNLQQFDNPSNRPSADFDVSSILGMDVSVRRLTGASSATKTGVTWAGQSADSSGRITGSLDVEEVSNGVVRVLASEAVIVQRRV